MNKTVKTILYAGLIACAVLFGFCFYTHYTHFMQQTVDLEAPSKLERPTPMVEPRGAKFSQVIYFGAAFFVSVVGLGLMVGHDFSHIFGEKFGKMLFNEDGETIKKTDYEAAEEIWATGHHLEAIKLMRGYLQQNPREQHVAIRIAEIYEKDLQNPLAAALEYEEVLKQKLAPEQWGWTAIHLCNIYSTKLNQQAKAMALLQRINTDYGETAAAEKARKRLGIPEDSDELELSEDQAPIVEAEPPSEAPKKFAPDNSDLQSHFDKLHPGTGPVRKTKM